MASHDNQTTRRSGQWLRIAVIGRNPRMTLVRLLILVAACFIVFKFVLLPVRVEGVSMFPTYRNGSVHFIYRLAYWRHPPQRGDVVGIRLGGTNTLFRTPGIVYMKRILALPGETLTFHNGHALIDGAPLPEPYLKDPCDWNSAPIAVGSGQYYVVGDNRSMPREYHYQGRVAGGQIVGKVPF
jgi:signal peptidase I